VPIIPVVSAGAQDGWWVLSDGRWLSRVLHTHRFVRTDVLPITLSVPWGLTVGAPPYLPLPTRIILEVLGPIEFERSGSEAADDREYVETCHRRVLETMQLALDGLVQERRARRGKLFRAIGSA
jgi:1-acyl-sn-glycerol-3-phosphate acyltransferase